MNKLECLTPEVEGMISSFVSRVTAVTAAPTRLIEVLARPGARSRMAEARRARGAYRSPASSSTSRWARVAWRFVDKPFTSTGLWLRPAGSSLSRIGPESESCSHNASQNIYRAQAIAGNGPCDGHPGKEGNPRQDNHSPLRLPSQVDRLLAMKTRS